MVKAYLVNHTHWDREWYFTTQDAQVLSDQLFTDVLDELEAHPEANFTLDGQMSIVDEYLELHPENRDRIKKLTERGQLFLGPWYTQTDALVPNAESIIHNLIIGILDARMNFGRAMMLGYLPDTFGFNANMPMLLGQVGIKDFLCWRGTDFKRQVQSPYFKWKSLGNRAVFAANFPLGYYTGQIALESKKHLQQFVEERLDPGIKFEAENGNNAEVLIPSGIDQMNIVHNISQTVDDINKLSQHHVEISTYPEFMSKLHDKVLPVYAGELRYPAYSRVHRTIGAVRSKNKRKNFQLEQSIQRRVEPLMLLAKKANIRVSQGLLIKLWKLTLDCHPHDTMGGSVTDNVAVDIDHRFKQAFEIADGLENYIKKRLAQRLHLTDHDVLLFNTDPFAFSGYKTIEFISQSKSIEFDSKYEATIIKSEYTPSRPNIMQLTSKGYEFKTEAGYYKIYAKVKVDLPGLSYCVLHFRDSKKELAELEKKNDSTITNCDVTLEFDGTNFNLKTPERDFKDVIRIHDQGNDGDTYDVSPLRGDHDLILPWTGKLIKESKNGHQRLILSGSWVLPYDLQDRRSKAKQIEVSYQLILTFAAGERVLSGKLIVDNQVLSHRLRLEMKTGINSSQAHAQIQGGFRYTKNVPIENDWQKEFVEKPVNIYVFDRVVGLHDEACGLYFFGKGQKNYELIDKSIFVTLMATTGQLGKANLLWRPGRASGDTTSVGHQMTPTPMAQELGKNSFEFGLAFFAGEDLREGKIIKAVNHWLAPSVSYQMQNYNLFVNRLDNKIWDIEFSSDLPKATLSASYLDLQLDPSLEVSALYPAYTIDHGYVLRLANETGQVIDISGLKSAGYLLVNALEEKITGKYEVGPYDMISLVKLD
ncbi:alpha-mannosidase [Lactobacillus nasalidis]|uniref:Alpha-mannosidase n=1 Tax=Lactobacillus nasalidis TaxID=2797258 RepID=A0ABQ3W900_9LACO|nr:alpha-mannosidase [Lactobacillus nasalidis]GHV98071.1 alpha-mannosidase [Lactobacillus nasalidis]GHV99710.1 alpha-mannosidase [Lactobacillus nasalidis]GHW02142.1 alpha-mannosidase [Lactobacillus nasalidis]